MVDKVKCDHCGAETIRPITKEFDGKLMEFCCRGCLGVFEMMREENLVNPGLVDQEDKKNGIQDKG
jgi:hypothetical protein